MIALILITVLLLALSVKLTWRLLRFCGRLLGIFLSLGAFAIVGVLALAVFCLTKLLIPIIVVVAILAILSGLRKNRV